MTTRKRRIFFVNRYFYPDESATSQLLSDLAFGLADQYEVHVVCSRQLYAEPEAALRARETARGVQIHRLWTTRFGRRRLIGRAFDYLSFYLICALALTRYVRHGDIVVAETDPPLISVVAAIVARLRRAALVNWLQDVFPEVASVLGANPMPAAADALLRYVRNISLRTARMNVVLGVRMQEHLLTQNVPADKIEIIENWAPIELTEPKDPAESRLRVRQALQQRFVIQYSGNLGRAHEYVTLLGAAEILRDDPQVVFLMIGAGTNMDVLQRQVAERRLANVRFLPYQPRENLSDSLAAADVHLVTLIPALEGLIVPSKFYGILSAARPVIFIGDPDGELARVITAACCGLVVETGESASLVEAIRCLQSSRQRQQAMTQAARQLHDRYSLARAHRCWSALLARV
jgi:colanic acid biosynthesis glycosyl transferase WcaI